jgi:hypothetical protein
MFDDLLQRIHNPKRVKHIDPSLECIAKEFAADFGFAGRSQSLAEALQDALDDWLDDQEQADRAVSV